MDTPETLKEQLQTALSRLHDPDYQPPDLLCVAMDCNPRDGPTPVQSALIQWIERLAPDPAVPRGARPRQVYDVIRYRYVLRLTQEEASECLHLSVRHLNRIQREGIHALARILWEHGHTPGSPPDEPSGEGTGELQEHRPPHSQAPDWRSQAERELASLRRSAPESVSNVAETLASALELARPLLAGHGVRAEVQFIQPNLTAAVHPSALHQLVLGALGRLAPHVPGGQIAVFAGLEDANVRITMVSTLTSETRPAEGDLVRDILAPADVAVEARLDGDHAFLWIRAPSTGRMTVLVVDDNPDMVHFYRRCTAGTKYRIVQATHGRDVHDAVESVAPDIIVLDVMLPDIDGWRLLMQLRESPATREVPVIVCTVVREQELALSLGAALYLPKPIRPRQFTLALDQTLSQVSAGASTAQDRSAEPC